MLRRQPLATAGIIALVMLTASSSGAASGDLDLSFGQDGLVITDSVLGGTGVAIQPDGKIVTGGVALTPSGLGFGLTRHNTDGSLDPTFGTEGTVITEFPGATNAVARAMVLQPDGKIVLIGDAGFIEEDFALARYNSDGSLDPNFGSGGRVVTDLGSGFALGIAVSLQPDGKILVAGVSPANGGDFVLVRYKTDGSVDPTFGTSGVVTTDFASGWDGAQAIGLLGKRIVVAGFAEIGGGFDFALASYDQRGRLDPKFGSGGKVTTDVSGQDALSDLALDARRRIVAVGSVAEPPGGEPSFAVLRYTRNGSLDPSFGTGGTVTTDFGGCCAEALGVVLQADEKIVVVGYAFLADQDIALARYGRNGKLDPTFGAGGKTTTDSGLGDDSPDDLVLQQDGKIVVVGAVLFEGESRQLARYLGM